MRIFKPFILLAPYYPEGLGSGEQDSLNWFRDWNADRPDDEGGHNNEDGEEEAAMTIKMALRRAIVRHEARDGHVFASAVDSCMLWNAGKK
jgi:hypothetical protein